MSARYEVTIECDHCFRVCTHTAISSRPDVKYALKKASSQGWVRIKGISYLTRDYTDICPECRELGRQIK